MNIEENLRAFFYPQALALIGASNQQNKWGYRILDNVIRGKFQGKIFPINNKEKEICGLEAYPSINDVPGSVDLAIIAVPGKFVPRVIEDCVEKKVKAGIMITAGFGEIGTEGKYLEKDLAGIAREGGMVFSGPNCNGITSTANNLYAAMVSIFRMTITTLPLISRGSSLSIMMGSMVGLAGCRR